MNIAYERAELYGKPHIGEAFYPDERTRLGHLQPDALCAICGRLATNAHHIVPKGMGGGSAILSVPYKEGAYKLRSPLMAVCGMGNSSGCHRKLHDRDIEVRWEWDEDKYREWWWKGHFFEKMKPHDDRLYLFGRYILQTPEKTWEWRGHGIG